MFRPISVLTAAKYSGEAPNSPASAIAGSPGVRWMITKFTIMTAKIKGTASRILRSKYRQVEMVPDNATLAPLGSSYQNRFSRISVQVAHASSIWVGALHKSMHSLNVSFRFLGFCRYPWYCKAVIFLWLKNRSSSIYDYGPGFDVEVE